MDKLNQAQKDGVVVGLKDVAGVVPRLDVDQLLLQEPDTFNLFLLALQSLQEDDSSNIMGYYQIAGIVYISVCQ
jgi:tyrosinase